VVVVGSVNADYVLRLHHRPAPGETVGDAILELHPGGKGANQAVAAARCGVSVSMVARVGADSIGRTRIEDLVGEGVDTTHIRVSADTLTGVAFVTLTPDGENAIAVAPGANACLCPSDIEEAGALIRTAKVLAVQLEVPLESVVRAAELAGSNTTLILNCAPYRPLPAHLLAKTGVLVVNEREGAALSGFALSSPDDARRAAAVMHEMGPRVVVVTLGANGAVVVAPGIEEYVPAPRVRVVDTTGAGDAFVGAVAARLATCSSLLDAVAFGVAVGSATTETGGANAVVPPGLLAVRSASKNSCRAPKPRLC
jgi:ribokinase